MSSSGVINETIKHDNVVNSIHLIDEDKHFAKNLDTYVEKSYIGKLNDDTGLNYHIVSVFGSQSTGKSTLLNKLFGTHFDIMDEAKRQQTTKGIWFSHANYIASTDESTSCSKSNETNIYVLDVEGVDGRERADDKDFERKSALFALATSEILIVNIFEHQVGLYQGANMELLKTVMEVNLSLFHKQQEKCLLLFVVRDFTGLTPLGNLGQSLEADMKRIWADLNKPEECKGSKLENFFDLEFVSISHKVFKSEDFEMDIKRLGNDFSNDKLFNANKYHKRIPMDAWALYSKQIWDQIENNKDLDLPTQQILVSKFKCNEIMNNVYDDIFLPSFAAIELIEDSVASTKELKELRIKCTAHYDLHSSRYKDSVYQDIKQDLFNKMDIKLEEFQTKVLRNLSDGIVAKIEPDFVCLKKEQTNTSIAELINTVIANSKKEYESVSLNYLIVDDLKANSRYSDNLEEQRDYLEKKMTDVVRKLKLKASNNLVKNISKKFQTNFKDIIVEELSQPSAESWDVIMFKYEKLKERLLKRYEFGATFNFDLGLNNSQDEELYIKVQKKIWDLFDNVVHDFVNDDTVARILRNVFEDTFKYDDKGMPLILETIPQLDSRFNFAKNKTLDLLSVMSSIKLNSGEKICKPQFKVEDEEGNDYESDMQSEYDENNEKIDKFITLLSTKEQAKVKQRFKRESDALYLDSKRAMVANKTSIPVYIWMIILVLGWNEFMAILRNPFLFVIAIIGLTSFYFAYNTQMLGPILTVVSAMLNQTKVVVKNKLRDVLLDDHDMSAQKITSEKEESCELKDL